MKYILFSSNLLAEKTVLNSDGLRHSLNKVEPLQYFHGLGSISKLSKNCQKWSFFSLRAQRMLQYTLNIRVYRVIFSKSIVHFLFNFLKTNSRNIIVEMYIQFWKMNPILLVNKHYWNGVTLTGQNLSLKCL